ncbi:MAG: hypothetical protein KBC47_02935 [Candidatus Peribacteraceae bacterium]|nr:hypothetical protein [Candidatus Peribacteraceae bacterium]
MATYSSPQLQKAEHERLYLNGDALPEILAAGAGAPDAKTQRHIQRFVAESHVAFLQTLPMNAPRLRMDLLEKGLISEDTVEESENRAAGHNLNNKTAALIVHECRSGDVERLHTLAGLLKYQVRLDDPAFQKQVTNIGGERLTESELAGFIHQAHVADAQHKLSLWQKSQSDLDWLMFLQAMENHDIPFDDVDMTPDEIQKYTDR